MATVAWFPPSQFMTSVTWGVPNDQLSEEEKKIQVYRWVCLLCRYDPKWTAAVPQLLSGIAL